MDYAETVRSNVLVRLFINLPPLTSSDRCIENGHILVVSSGLTKIRIFVHWKQRIVELNIEYLFNP